LCIKAIAESSSLRVALRNSLNVSAYCDGLGLLFISVENINFLANAALAGNTINWEGGFNHATVLFS